MVSAFQGIHQSCDTHTDTRTHVNMKNTNGECYHRDARSPADNYVGRIYIVVYRALECQVHGQFV